MTLINYYYYIEHLKQIFVIYFKVGWGGGPCFSEFGVKRGPDFKDLTPELELGEGAG